MTQAFQLAFQDNAPASSILLTGDSGTGKSYIIHHLAQAHHATVYTALLGDLAATQRGQLSKGFKRLLWKASATPKSLLLIEDVDLFFPRHGQSTQDPSLAALLQSLMQESKVMLVATTRRPDHVAMDVRTLFQDEIGLQIPTPTERKHMMKHTFTTVFPAGTAITEHGMEQLSARAHAFVAADLALWVQLAEQEAIKSKRAQGKSASHPAVSKHDPLSTLHSRQGSL